MNVAFAAKLPADPQKLRGGYYTPPSAAEFLVRWAVRSGNDRVLEPSCGDGNFLVPLARRIKELRRGSRRSEIPSVVAIEVETQELEKAQLRLAAERTTVPVEWIGDDFFRAYSQLKSSGFDAVVGNPPFIRFQHFRDESRNTAFARLREAGYRPTKLANAWAAFVQLSIELLRPGGRLAMVVPAELLQVQYASELRSRIVAYFEHVVVVGFRRLIFPEIQQEVVLLLAEGKRQHGGTDCDIHVVDVSDQTGLTDDVFGRLISHAPVRHSRPGMKWTSLYLSETAFGAIDRAQVHAGMKQFGSLASVDVGVVTGLNKFFVIDDATASALGATELTVPVVGKTGALKGIRFCAADFREYRKVGKSRLLDLNGVPTDQIPERLCLYIADGESNGANRGYKCRIRKRWFDVPSIYAPDAFLYRQIHGYPLLVTNEVQATATDTIHRVRIARGVAKQLLAATFVNSLTFAWAEVAGRSYGGGVLELEPREAEQLPVPYASELKLDVAKVDVLIRRGNVDAALDYVDETVLVKRLGFTFEDTRAMRAAWRELSERRINRR